METLTRRVKNDHVFHNACLNNIVQHYQKQFNVKKVDVWTDNCGNQYKCPQNFLAIATFGKRLAALNPEMKDIILSHYHAIKHGFKNLCDSQGKFYKQKASTYEKSGAGRLDNAEKLLRVMPAIMNPLPPYDQYLREGDPCTLQRTQWTVTARHYGLCSDDAQQVQRFWEEGLPNILFADRVNIPDMDVVNGTHGLCFVSSTLDTRTEEGIEQMKLTIVDQPCACLRCWSLLLGPCR